MSENLMNNITKIVTMGLCVGCGECRFCEHIAFKNNRHGVPTPVVAETCTSCGECLHQCIYNPENED